MGNTVVPSEKGRLVVAITAAFSARSALSGNRSSAPTSARANPAAASGSRWGYVSGMRAPTGCARPAMVPRWGQIRASHWGQRGLAQSDAFFDGQRNGGLLGSSRIGKRTTKGRQPKGAISVEGHG